MLIYILSESYLLFDYEFLLHSINVFRVKITKEFLNSKLTVVLELWTLLKNPFQHHVSVKKLLYTRTTFRDVENSSRYQVSLSPYLYLKLIIIPYGLTGQSISIY